MLHRTPDRFLCRVLKKRNIVIFNKKALDITKTFVYFIIAISLKGC